MYVRDNLIKFQQMSAFIIIVWQWQLQLTMPKTYYYIALMFRN